LCLLKSTNPIIKYWHFETNFTANVNPLVETAEPSQFDEPKNVTCVFYFFEIVNFVKFDNFLSHFNVSSFSSSSLSSLLLSESEPDFELLSESEPDFELLSESSSSSSPSPPAVF